MLHDFHEEHAKEAFKSKDPNGTGYISALDFLDIMVSVKKHLLTHDVKDNLVAVSRNRFVKRNDVHFQQNHKNNNFVDRLLRDVK